MRHKIISVVLLAVLLGAGYFGCTYFFAGKKQTTYASQTVSKGTITTVVSGSGQVGTLNEIALSFKASGQILYVGVKDGQQVQKGQLIASLDATNAVKQVRNAEQSLASAQIAMQKLKGVGDLPVPKNKQDAEDSLAKDYESGFNSVANAFLDLPAIMTGLDSMLHGNDFNNYQQNKDFYGYTANAYDSKGAGYSESAEASYKKAKESYDKTFSDYKTTTRFSDNAAIDSIINETYGCSKDVAQAVKDANNLVQFYKDTLAGANIKTNPLADTHLSSLGTYLSKANTALQSLLASKETIRNDKYAVQSADLDLQSQSIDIQSKQNALADAKSALADYYIYAPFAGTVGKVAVQKYQNAGSSTSVATLITNQKVVAIPLNEVDSSKVKVGQKAVLTFDALPDLSISGQVISVDPIGTVSQGVVTYTVKISFDTDNSDIKSGMSVNADIITNVKQDALIVPNTAVKTQGGAKYVQILVNGQPQQQTVTTGLSNDTDTEILTGVNEGDTVVTQTIKTGTGSSTTSGSQRNGGTNIRLPGIGGGRFGG